jgi:large subunit ribosomal protein L5
LKDDKVFRAYLGARAVRGNGKMTPRLKVKYREEIVPKMVGEFGYKNFMSVPKVEKVVINMGVGKDYIPTKNTKVLEVAAEEIAAITGQRPIVTRAKKSIASFKLRENDPIGVMVTLRGDKMYEFLDRLLSIALPRVRDFRGVSSKAFDGRGNYTLGLKDQLLFPEVDFAKVDKARGMNVCIVTTAKSDEEGRALLRAFGMPFRQN